MERWERKEGEEEEREKRMRVTWNITKRRCRVREKDF